MGGRLLVLGESRHPAVSPPPDITSGGTAGLTPLEELASLINAAAPFCAPPRPSRWRGLLQLFAATATPDGLGAPMAISAFERSDVQREGRQLKEKGRSTQGPLEGAKDAGINSPGSSIVACSAASDAGAHALYGAPHRDSLLALLVRCSLAACHVICRPLTLVSRLPSLASTPSWRTGGVGPTQSISARGCSKCDFSPTGDDGLPSTRKECSYGCAWGEQSSRRGRGDVCLTANTSRPQRTLRQLIDDQQRAVAAFAVRERCRKVALLQEEYQMLHQQASRALMDEHGQLFPQVGLLLSVCLHELQPLLLMMHLRSLSFCAKLSSCKEHSSSSLPGRGCSVWSFIVFVLNLKVNGGFTWHASTGTPLGGLDGRAAADALPYRPQMEDICESAQLAAALNWLIYGATKSCAWRSVAAIRRALPKLLGSGGLPVSCNLFAIAGRASQHDPAIMGLLLYCNGGRETIVQPRCWRRPSAVQSYRKQPSTVGLSAVGLTCRQGILPPIFLSFWQTKTAKIFANH